MKFESKTAVINYEESDVDLVKILAEYLDKNVQSVYDFFEVVPKEKAIINIIPTKEEYDKIYRKSRGLPEDYPLEKWMIGNCRNGVITYLSLHDYKSTTHRFANVEFEEAIEYYKKTILHEYVHYVNETFNQVNDCGYTERYLVEGIATYLSKQKNGQEHPINASIDKILNKENYYYDDYYLLTKYFVENYDKEYVLEVFQSNRQARELLTNELYAKAKEYYREKV
jgi:hypothetical protein